MGIGQGGFSRSDHSPNMNALRLNLLRKLRGDGLIAARNSIPANAKCSLISSEHKAATSIRYLLENTNSFPSGSRKIAIVPQTSFFGSAASFTPFDFKASAVAKTSSHRKVTG